jgi:hypothetical protein
MRGVFIDQLPTARPSHYPDYHTCPGMSGGRYKRKKSFFSSGGNCLSHTILSRLLAHNYYGPIGSHGAARATTSLDNRLSHCFTQTATKRPCHLGREKAASDSEVAHRTACECMHLLLQSRLRCKQHFGRCLKTHCRAGPRLQSTPLVGRTRPCKIIS